MEEYKKLRLPKIGQKIYQLTGLARWMDIEINIRESVITGVLVDEDKNIFINLDYIKESGKGPWNGYSPKSHFIKFNRENMWFSLRKAENVRKQKKTQRENIKVKEEQRQKTFETLKSNLDDVVKEYINKEVLVKVGGDNPEYVWRRDIIRGLHPHPESNSYTLLFHGIDVRTNHYLLGKEGKSWKFYTEELALQNKKDALLKQISDIDKKLQEIDNETI